MADVLGMEAVDILARVNAMDQSGGVPAVRQWQLHEDAMHIGIGVEYVDQCQQVGIVGAGRQVVIDRADAHFLRGAALVAHVHTGGGIVADQHHGQPRSRPARGNARVDLRLEGVEQFLGNPFAVEDLRL